MPISVYTGKPGNGKTALMMEHLLEVAEKAERPIYAAGIDGLRPGVATVLSDPTKWNAVDPNSTGTCECTAGAPGHAHVVPDGAIIFVDEAWKWFGHLHDASRQATPAHVLQLAEHRHRGIDFVWTTQGPNQLYPFVRNLIADHTHVVRRFGTEFIDVFKWEELNEDIKSGAKRDNALRSTRKLPEKVFGSYKSAEVHTIKRNIPWRVVALPVLLVAAVLCGWLAFVKLRPSAMAEAIAAQGPDAALAAPGLADLGPSRDRTPRRAATVEEYVAMHQPRIATMPHSAPVFDERKAGADPQLYCMHSHAGIDGDGNYAGNDSCRCLTEQGTLYLLDMAQCAYVARWGAPYNPYRERQQEQRTVGYEQAQADAPRGLPVGVPGDAGIGAQPAAYGAMRATGW